MYLSSKAYTTAEYIWIDGMGRLRSKTRCLKTSGRHFTCETIPSWNYDGSSTFQSSSEDNTEIILKPAQCYTNPLRDISKTNNIIVLCDTYDINDEPIVSNTRYNANNIFEKDLDKTPWFGLEQEYYMVPISMETKITNNYQDGTHYCGIELDNIQRQIAEEHLAACIKAGITISGLNAEVAHNQWEFQIGPCEGIKAGDDLYVARYLLERIAQKHNYRIEYNPKPYPKKSGSGCHVNFSTKETRDENGLDIIYKFIEKLESKHDEHKMNFGKNNKYRLTGEYETANHDYFTCGIGTRNTSVRIGNQTYNEKMGYFEDRRPGANIDPYVVTSQMFKTCCID